MAATLLCSPFLLGIKQATCTGYNTMVMTVALKLKFVVANTISLSVIVVSNILATTSDNSVGDCEMPPCLGFPCAILPLLFLVAIFQILVTLCFTFSFA